MGGNRVLGREKEMGKSSHPSEGPPKDLRGSCGSTRRYLKVRGRRRTAVQAADGQAGGCPTPGGVHRQRSLVKPKGRCSRSSLKGSSQRGQGEGEVMCHIPSEDHTVGDLSGQSSGSASPMNRQRAPSEPATFLFILPT